MVDESALADRYAEPEIESLRSAFEILSKLRFFEFVVEQNNRLLVESYNDESVEEITKKVLENKQKNRILLSICDIQSTLEEMSNA